MVKNKGAYSINEILAISVFVMFILTFGIMFLQYFFSTLSVNRISSIDFFDIENTDVASIARDIGNATKKNPLLSMLLGDIYSEKYQMEYEDEEENPAGSEIDNSGENIKNDSLPDEYYNRALSYYISSINQNPLLAESHIKIGELYFLNGKYSEASKSFDNAAKLDRNNAYNLIKIADYYIRMGYYDEGKEILKKSCMLVDKLLGRAMQVIFDASGSLEDLEEITPKTPDSYMSLGRFLQRNGLTDDALNIFYKAKKYDPQNIEPYKAIEKIFRSRNDTESAIDLWSEAIEFNPDNPDLFFKIGVAYINAGDDFSGIDNIEKALKKANTSTAKKTHIVDYHSVLMNVYFKMKDYRRALDSADAILNFNKKQAKAYYYKALCEEQIKYDIRGVLLSLRKAVEIEPGNVAYRITLANAYKDYGFYRNALREWQRISSEKKYADRALKEMAQINTMMQSDK